MAFMVPKRIVEKFLSPDCSCAILNKFSESIDFLYSEIKTGPVDFRKFFMKLKFSAMTPSIFSPASKFTKNAHEEALCLKPTSKLMPFKNKFPSPKYLLLTYIALP